MDDDLGLLERFKAGDAGAFDELMQKHYKAVLNLIYRFTGVRGEEAEDLAQEVFLRIYRAAPRFEARARFFTYLYKVTMNLCLKERQRWSRRKTVSLDAVSDDNAPSAALRNLADTGPSLQDSYERGEMAEAIRRAVMELPEDQRQAVILHRYHDLSYEEITEVLGISLPAVKSRLHRAKLALQRRLQDLLAPPGPAQRQREVSGN
ncbi:MAG TPA: RNA polymerase sigma factor [Candidatus Nitrosotenuis sp.]|nr:RNA polymerase sigma factor [Candidatus Nitrosotenuis sp.]